jgi:two-component system LytT family sensor kinase
MELPAQPAATSTTLPRPWHPLVLLAGMAFVLSLVFVLDGFVYWSYMAAGAHLTFERVVAAPVTRALLWTACAPVVVRLVRWVPLRAPHFVRALAIHLCLAVALGILAITVYSWLLIGHGPFEAGWHWTLIWIPEWLPLYTAIAGAVHAYDTHVRALGRERQAAELRARLAEAQITLLRQQLHPHFVFNTLQALSTLMHRDLDAADALLGRVSHLLRRLLDLLDRREISLGEELDFIESYLAIERTRLGEGLEVRTDVDPTLLACEVPPLLLQPLVENALKHGIVPRGAGRIAVSAAREGGQLVIEVRDDGQGLPAGFSPADYGVGLRATEARALGGAACRLTVQNLEGGGVVARVMVPCAPGATAESS